MAVYLIDTNILIDAIRQKRGRWDLLKGIVDGGGTLACSVVTIGEIYSGMRPHEKAGTEELLSEFQYYDVNAGIAKRAGHLKNEWAGKGRALTLPDMFIAATAIIHRQILVTSNLKDFPMAEVHLYQLTE